MDVILNRRSVRSFEDRKISDVVMKEIIHAGISAPSARNQQPWEFVVVNDKEVLKELAKVSSNLYASCDQAIITCINDEGLINPGMSVVDLGLCTENMVLKACELGIGSCIIGTYPEVENMKKIIEVLNLPANLLPYTGIVFGYPAETGVFKAVNREAKIHYNKF